MAQGTTAHSQPDQLMATAADLNCGAGHQEPVSCVTLSLDGNKIASASTDGDICLWDGNTGAWCCTAPQKHHGRVSSLVFSTDAKYLISASVDDKVCVWDVKSAEGKMALVVKHSLLGHKDWLRDATISPSNQLVATASDDKAVRVWDISTPATASNDQEAEDANGSMPVRVFRGHKDYVYSVAFSPDGLRLASAGNDLHVMIWNLGAGGGNQGDKNKPDKDMVDPRVSNYIRGLVFSADGSKVVSVCDDDTVAIWSPDLLKEQQCIILMVVEERLVPGAFKSMRIDEQNPEVLLTEFCAWDFDIGNAALEEAATAAQPSSASLLPRRERPPKWSPFGIGEGYASITWNKDKRIFLPTEYRPTVGPGISCRLQGQRVVVGCESGQVLLFRFSEDIEPTF